MAVRTFADMFNPLQTLQQIQQIKGLQQQQQARQMQLAQAQQAAQQQGQFQKFLAQPQGPSAVLGALQAPPQAPMPAPVPTPTPVVPPPAIPDDTAKETMAEAQRLGSALEAEITSEKPNMRRLEFLNRQAQSPKMKQAVQQYGFDNIEYGYDEDKQQAWQRFTKDWSKEELDKLAQTVPGASFLEGVQPGKYTLEYDPVKKRLKPMIKSDIDITSGASLLPGKGLSKIQLMNIAENDPNMEKRAQANKVIKKMKAYDIDVARERYEAVSDIPFAQWNPEDKELAVEAFIMHGERPRFSRGDKKSYSQFSRAVAEYKRENNLTTAQAKAKASQFKALEKSFEKQQSKLDSMKQFVGSLNKEIIQIDKYIDNLQRFNPRLLNIPITALKRQIVGTPLENRLNYYLEEIASDAARISGGATESVSELTQSAQERWQKIFDPNLSIAGLKDIIATAGIAGADRLAAMQETRDETLGQMETMTLKKMPEEKNKEMRAMPSPAQNKGRVIKDTSTGQRYRSDGQSWRKI